MTSGDPTQRLLTVLGRFEREMLKGREGAAQQKWSDAAMQQLINAAEIAVEQTWRDMVEALTETGRILETYEKAGRANECVPFLADSYEILCLMVGDLIVDKVRSGVMRKWRERYEVALEDIAAEGLTLVKDEDDNGGKDVAPAQPVPEPMQQVPAEPPAATPTGPGRLDAAEPAPVPEPKPEPAESPFDAVPEEPETEPELDDVPVLDLDSSDGQPLTIATPWGEQTGTQDVSEGDSAPPEPSEPAAQSSLDAEGFSFHKSGAPEEPPSKEAEHLGEDDAEEESESLSSVTVYTLDALAEALSRLKRDDAESAALTRAAIEENVSVLGEQASQADHGDAVAACEQMRNLLSQCFGEPIAPDDEFYELAYAFCGAFAESCEGDDTAGARWATECEGYLNRAELSELEAVPSDMESPEDTLDESGPVSEPAQEPESVVLQEAGWQGPGPFAEEPEPPEMAQAPMDTEPAVRAEDEETGPAFDQADAREFVENTFQEALDVSAEETPDVPPAAGTDEARETPGEKAAPARLGGNGTAEHLLASAVSAASSGDAAQAKTLALEAAARFARAQAEEAEARVKAAEARFQEGTRAIETAREALEQSELAVAQVEEETAGARQRLDDRTERTAEIDGQLQEVDGRLAELERQLRELEAKRDEVAAEKQQVEERLDGMRGEMNEAQAQLDEQTRREESARTALEQAREQLAEQQRKRSEAENALERARQMLSRQQTSIADIERTIEQIQGTDADEDGGPVF